MFHINFVIAEIAKVMGAAVYIFLFATNAIYLFFFFSILHSAIEALFMACSEAALVDRGSAVSPH